MSAVIVKLTRRSSHQKSWSNQEMAEMYLVVDMLRRARLPVDIETGISDEGDPWNILYREDTGDVIAHVAKIDGIYIIAGLPHNEILRGLNFHELIIDLLKRQPLAAIHGVGARSNVYLHPVVVLSAALAALLLTAEHTDAQAAGLALDAESKKGDVDRAGPSAPFHGARPSAVLSEGKAPSTGGLSAEHIATLSTVVMVASLAVMISDDPAWAVSVGNGIISAEEPSFTDGHNSGLGHTDSAGYSPAAPLEKFDAGETLLSPGHHDVLGDLSVIDDGIIRVANSAPSESVPNRQIVLVTPFVEPIVIAQDDSGWRSSTSALTIDDPTSSLHVSSEASWAAHFVMVATDPVTTPLQVTDEKTDIVILITKTVARDIEGADKFIEFNFQAVGQTAAKETANTDPGDNRSTGTEPNDAGKEHTATAHAEASAKKPDPSTDVPEHIVHASGSTSTMELSVAKDVVVFSGGNLTLSHFQLNVDRLLIDPALHPDTVELSRTADHGFVMHFVDGSSITLVGVLLSDGTAL